MRTRNERRGLAGLALVSLLTAGLCLGAWTGPAGLSRPGEAHADARSAWMPRALIINAYSYGENELRKPDDAAAAEKLSELGFLVDHYKNNNADGPIPWAHWTLADLFRRSEYNLVVYYGHGNEDWGMVIGERWDYDTQHEDYRFPLEEYNVCDARRIWGDHTRNYAPWKDRNGTEYPFKLAENALVLFSFNTCYSDGVSAEDIEPNAPLLSDAEVLRRVNEYSYTFLHRDRPGAGTYVACPSGRVTYFLDTLAKSPTTPIGQLAVPDYSSSGAVLLEGAHPYMGGAGMRYRKNKWPGETNGAVWMNGAWAGDPKATFLTVTRGHVPGDKNGDGDNTDWGEIGYQPEQRDTFTGEDPSCNFFPFLCVANPGGVGTTAEVTFYDENGEYLKVYRDVPGNSRITLDLGANPYLRDKNLAVRVRSLDPGVPLLAERPMYFRYHGWMDGGSDAFGAAEGATSWYFAEGYASDSFDEYICLANFGARAAKGVMTLYREGAPPVEVAVSVPAGARQTHLINAHVQGNVSVKVETDQPIVAERSMYFRYHSRNGFHCDGGHTKRGLTALGTSWYLAEGYVAGEFEEWVLLVNPNPKAAEVRMSYYTHEGKHSERKYTLPPQSRHTVYVNDSFSSPTDVSVGVESVNGVPIAAERSMYFSYNGWADDGHVSPGVSAPSKEWYFAEGSTYGGIHEYVLLVNPGDKPATVTATYLLGAGQGTHTATYALGPKSRATVYVNAEMAALGYPSEVGLKLSSTQPIVAERSMYFDMGRAYGGLEPIRGGHVSLGATEPAVEWLFAEAYTGK